MMPSVMVRGDTIKRNRQSIRLPAYDYAGGGTFFVTLCCHNRIELFGCVDQGAMRMNEYGWIVWEEWEQSAAIRSGLELIAHVVMPNHFHGLVALPPAAAVHRDHQQGARSAPLQRQAGSLGSFIAGFKAACTRQINDIRGCATPPVWQRGYWEHVVRNERATERIYDYIETNPLRWSSDRENPAFGGEDVFDSWLRDVATTLAKPPT